MFLYCSMWYRILGSNSFWLALKQSPKSAIKHTIFATQPLIYSVYDSHLRSDGCSTCIQRIDARSLPSRFVISLHVHYLTDLHHTFSRIVLIDIWHRLFVFW